MTAFRFPAKARYRRQDRPATNSPERLEQLVRPASTSRINRARRPRRSPPYRIMRAIASAWGGASPSWSDLPGPKIRIRQTAHRQIHLVRGALHAARWRYRGRPARRVHGIRRPGAGG